MSDECQLYRHYDNEENLLYVGISLSAFERFRAHKMNSKWANKVSKMTVEYFSSRKEASDAEKEAILIEKPLYNIVYNNDSKNILHIGGYAIDIDSKKGKMIMSIITYIMDCDAEYIQERKEKQLKGLMIAKQNGIKIGRNSVLSDEEVDLLRKKRDNGVLIKDLMKEFSISKATVYNYLKSRDTNEQTEKWSEE